MLGQEEAPLERTDVALDCIEVSIQGAFFKRLNMRRSRLKREAKKKVMTYPKVFSLKLWGCLPCSSWRSTPSSLSALKISSAKCFPWDLKDLFNE